MADTNGGNKRWRIDSPRLIINKHWIFEFEWHEWYEHSGAREKKMFLINERVLKSPRAWEISFTISCIRYMMFPSHVSLLNNENGSQTTHIKQTKSRLGRLFSSFQRCTLPKNQELNGWFEWIPSITSRKKIHNEKSFQNIFNDYFILEHVMSAFSHSVDLSVPSSSPIHFISFASFD